MRTSRLSLAKAIWQLLRLEHGLMYGIGVIIGIFVANPNFSSFEYLVLGFATALFLQASAFALNDYLDYEVDVANKRLDRPLVRGELSKNDALVLTVVTLPIGLFAAFLISHLAFLFALAVTVAGYAYNIWLKKFGFLGNIYIALSMAAPFLFGSIVAANTIKLSAALLSSMAFLSGLGREIMKGIEDVEGDALRNVRTIARVKGAEIAAKLAAVFYVSAVLISPLPLIALKEYYMDVKYALPVAVTDVMLIAIAASLVKKHERNLISKYRKQTLIAMLFGLLGFLAGAV